MTGRPAALAIAAAIVLAVVPAAGAQGRLTIVSGAPLELTLKPRGTGVAAESTILVHADGAVDGLLAARLVGARGAGVTLTAAPAGRPLELTTRRPLPIRIHAGQIRRVPLELAFATTPKTPYAGTLLVSVLGSSARPAVAKLTAAVDDASRWAAARLQPATLTVSTSGCSPRVLQWDCHPPDDERIRVTGLAPGALISKGTPIATAVAQAGTGGRADAVLTAAEDIGPDVTEADLVLATDHVRRGGSYELSLPTDRTADKAPTVTVKLAARDFFLWPLLTLLAGAGLAYLLLRHRERERPKKVLEHALLDAGARCGSAHGRLPAGSACPYDAGRIFPLDGVWKAQGEGAPTAVALRRDIGNAKTDEQLAALAEQVEAAVAVGDGWLETCRRATALRDATDRIEQRPGAAPIVAKSRAACAPSQAPPADGPALAALQVRLADQTQAVELWGDLDRLISRAEELYDAVDGRPQLDREERARLEQFRPEALRAAYLSRAETLDDLRESGVISAIREHIRVLAALELANPQQAPRRGADRRSEAAAPALDTGTLQATLLGGLLARLAGRERAEVPVPEQLLARIVRADRVEFLISSMIATVAFFATIYPKDTFGSVWDYVAAFAAGAAGELAINWKLLPWHRSYEPRKALAADA